MSEAETDDVIFNGMRFPKKWNLPAGTQIGTEDYLTEASIDEQIPDMPKKRKKSSKKPKKKKKSPPEKMKDPQEATEQKKDKKKTIVIIPDDISDKSEDNQTKSQ